MKWKAKAHLLALLSRMPAGRHVYHGMQRIAGTNRLHLDRDLGRVFELLSLGQLVKRSPEGANVLEVGTGWRPFVPFVYALAGAKSVCTIDVNPWLTLAYARETWHALQPHLEEISAQANVSLSAIEKRYRAVKSDVRSLPDLLRQLNITYVYPGDARSTGLPDRSLDYVVSSNVLEHIPRDVQMAIHQESCRVLKPGGIAVHRFNPQDHYATVDSRITHANFLQYSTKKWNWLGGSGLAYHNRLRAPDYREMFKATGFELAVCRERLDERSLKAIENGELKLSGEFACYTPHELAIDYMWVVAQKPAGSLSAEKTLTAGHLSTAPLWASTHP